MFTYLFFLTPELIYEMLPFGVLVAVLVQLGVLSKQNEITAFRACGVSLYRLAMPILLAGTLFAGALFAFDYYYVPGANVKQDALRDEIKGRPKQTYLRADHKWIMGHVAHLLLRVLRPSAGIMPGVNVFDLDPNTFRLQREIVAERAQWSPCTEDVGFRKRLELPLCRRLLQRLPILFERTGRRDPLALPT